MDNINNLEDMKSMWIELNNRISFLEEDNRKLAAQIRNDRYKTVQNRLINKYIKFIWLEAIFAILMPVFIVFNGNEKFKVITTIYWFCFFVIALAFDYYLLSNVRLMDLNNASVSEIVKLSSKNWKLHKLWIIIGMPVAVGACILYALALDADMVVIVGMIAGGVVGLIIGLTQFFKIRHNYYLLQSPQNMEDK